MVVGKSDEGDNIYNFYDYELGVCGNEGLLAIPPE
jgi:hypothetical protein